MKNKNVKILNEEQKPKYAKDAFRSVIPDFSFSVSGTQVVFRVMSIVGAERYEVYQSETSRGKYAKIVTSTSPVIEFYVPDGESFYYKVRAFHGSEGDSVATCYSESKHIDFVAAAKPRDERMDKFLAALKDAGDVLSFEDLDIAIESLKVAGLESREREARRKLEEDAEKKKKEIEAQNLRRQAAAKRAAARREKKRIEHVNEVRRLTYMRKTIAMTEAVLNRIVNGYDEAGYVIVPSDGVDMTKKIAKLGYSFIPICRGVDKTETHLIVLPFDAKTKEYRNFDVFVSDLSELIGAERFNSDSVAEVKAGSEISLYDMVTEHFTSKCLVNDFPKSIAEHLIRTLDGELVRFEFYPREDTKKYYDVYGNPATEGHWEGDLYFPIYDEEGNEYVPKELWED